jgi:hypothetical protein
MRGVRERYAGHFQLPSYDGSYGTTQADAARGDFAVLTNYEIGWAQVHGDTKNTVSRAMFEPYTHWRDLYAACRDIVRQHCELDTEYWGPLTDAKIMGDVMTLLRKRDGLNVPKWWLPIMSKIRKQEKQSRQAEVS